MSIGVATFAFPISYDKEANVSSLLSCIHQAREAGADLVVFPEVCIQGYPVWGRDVDKYNLVTETYATAEEVPGGASAHAVAACAQDLGVHVVYGITEKSGNPGVLYNTAVLTGPEGYIGKYRKVHLGVTERLLWQPGDRWPVYETALGRIGMLICYDKAWPESCRELTLRGAEILAMPTAWSEELSIHQYRLYDMARAAENTRWFVSANAAGVSGSRHFFGLSQVVDPMGAVVASTGITDSQAMAFAKVEVEGDILDAYAKTGGARLPRDRRPETYTFSSGRYSFGAEAHGESPDASESLASEGTTRMPGK